MTLSLTQILATLAFAVVVGGGLALSYFSIPSPAKEMHCDIPRERWVCFRAADPSK